MQNCKKEKKIEKLKLVVEGLKEKGLTAQLTQDPGVRIVTGKYTWVYMGGDYVLKVGVPAAINEILGTINRSDLILE